MRGLRLVVVVLVLGLVAVGVPSLPIQSQTQNPRDVVAKALGSGVRAFALAQVDIQAVERDAKGGRPVTLPIAIRGKNAAGMKTLDLRQIDAQAAGGVAGTKSGNAQGLTRVSIPAAAYFAGTVQGQRDSEAILSIDAAQGHIDGYVLDRDGMALFQSTANALRAAGIGPDKSEHQNAVKQGNFVTYHAADAFIDLELGTDVIKPPAASMQSADNDSHAQVTSIEEAATQAAEQINSSIGSLIDRGVVKPANDDSCIAIQVTADGDRFFYAAYPSNWYDIQLGSLNYIDHLLGNCSGTSGSGHSSRYRIRLTVYSRETWVSGGPDSTDCGTLLGQFRSFSHSHAPKNAYVIGFSGLQISGARGCAWQQGFGTSLHHAVIQAVSKPSGYNADNWTRMLVAAHELGHGMDTIHDNPAGSIECKPVHVGYTGNLIMTIVANVSTRIACYGGDPAAGQDNNNVRIEAYMHSKLVP